jgi:hypothetical protein
VVNHWQQKNVLPEKISDLQDSISGFFPPVGPDGVAYEYTVKDSLTFELCATFKTASVGSDTSGRTKPMPIGFVGDPYSQNWNHGIGRTCFSRSIDPELYKTNKPVPMIIQ